MTPCNLVTGFHLRCVGRRQYLSPKWVNTNQTARFRNQQKHNMDVSKPDLKPDMLSSLHVKTTGNGSSIENPSLIPLIQLWIALTKKPHNGRFIEKRILGQMTAEQALVVVSDSLPPFFRWRNGKYKVCQNSCFMYFISIVSTCVSSTFVWIRFRYPSKLLFV